MSRREAREVVFKTLFEQDLNPGLELSVAIQTAKDENQTLTGKDEEFALYVLNGVAANIKDIDAFIEESSAQWRISRMAAVDRAILRLATFEMKFGEEKLTSKIVINEAVELAKKYGSDESSRFINGVLSGILKKPE